MTFDRIQLDLVQWAERHQVVWLSSSLDRHTKFCHISSNAGECFQIWIEQPVDGYIWIHAGGVESRRDDAPPEDWYVPVASLNETLEEAFLTVTAWMLPSKRFFPPQTK